MFPRSPCSLDHGQNPKLLQALVILVGVLFGSDMQQARQDTPFIIHYCSDHGPRIEPCLYLYLLTCLVLVVPTHKLRRQAQKNDDVQGTIVPHFAFRHLQLGYTLKIILHHCSPYIRTQHEILHTHGVIYQGL